PLRFKSSAFKAVPLPMSSPCGGFSNSPPSQSRSPPISAPIRCTSPSALNPSFRLTQPATFALHTSNATPVPAIFSDRFLNVPFRQAKSPPIVAPTKLTLPSARNPLSKSTDPETIMRSALSAVPLGFLNELPPHSNVPPIRVPIRCTWPVALNPRLRNRLPTIFAPPTNNASQLPRELSSDVPLKVPPEQSKSPEISAPGSLTPALAAKPSRIKTLPPTVKRSATTDLTEERLRIRPGIWAEISKMSSVNQHPQSDRGKQSLVSVRSKTPENFAPRI